MSAYEIQHPNEDRLYTLEWSSWIDSGDSISTTAWAISPTGPTVTDLSSSGTQTSAQLSGLARGIVYRLTGQITSANGETAEQSIAIRCW